MFRLAVKRVSSLSTPFRHVKKNITTTASVFSMKDEEDQVKRHKEIEDEMDRQFIEKLNRDNIDGWELRQVLNEIHKHDMVPEPEIVIAAMNAARRVNDYSVAIRYLEAIKFKCGPLEKEIWPYMLQEIKPTLEKLGISTPEEMGYDKPELALKDVYDM